MEIIGPLLIVLVILIAIFFICRALLLWYWKVDVIVGLLQKQTELLHKQAEDSRKQARINYYTSLAINDKQRAYESLLNIVFDDLLKNGVIGEARKQLYAEIKEKRVSTFEKLGYPFPDYDLLF